MREEALHGAQWGDATCFPQAIGLAAMWDEPLMSRVCTAIARELKAVNIHHVFAPVINISRDSRWGRAQESYGEDVYLTCRMALAYVDAPQADAVVRCPEHQSLALEAARKAIVLLKNQDGVLPLRQDLKVIGVFGPAKDTVNLGDYSGPYGGWGGDGISPVAGIRAKAAPGTEIRVCGQRTAAAELARSCDVALYFATICEEEGSDRSNLDLPRITTQTEGVTAAAHAIIVEKRRQDIVTGDQEAEIREIAATGAPVVVVLLAGSAITVAAWIDAVAAVLLPWYGGEQGGTAIAEVLFGECNPGGRLPITFPKHVGRTIWRCGTGPCVAWSKTGRLRS